MLQLERNSGPSSVGKTNIHIYNELGFTPVDRTTIQLPAHELRATGEQAHMREEFYQQDMIDFVGLLKHREYRMRCIDTNLSHDQTPIQGLYLGNVSGEMLYHLRDADPITHGHKKTIANLTERLLIEMGMEQLAAAGYYSGYFHDINKLCQQDILELPDITTLESLGRIEFYDEYPFTEFIPNLAYRRRLQTTVGQPFDDEKKQIIHEHPFKGAVFLQQRGFPAEIVLGALLHHSFFSYKKSVQTYPEARSFIEDSGSTETQIPPYERFLLIKQQFESYIGQPFESRYTNEELYWIAITVNAADVIGSGREGRMYKPEVPQEDVLLRNEALISAGLMPPNIHFAYRSILFRTGGHEPWFRDAAIYIECVNPHASIDRDI